MDDEDGSVRFLDEISLSKSDGLESMATALTKYKTLEPHPVSFQCQVCGETVSTTQAWLLHHYTDWHRRVVQWVDSFRAKCIDQQDEDGETTFGDAIDAVKDCVTYTQELFELNGRLFCCACACEVTDIASHLASTRHNEMLLSIVDSSAFAHIKRGCLGENDRDINENTYRSEILQWLSQELPATADSPLEVVVLKNDDNFFDWFKKYCDCVNRVIELRKSKSVEQKTDEVPLQEKNSDPVVVKDGEGSPELDEKDRVEVVTKMEVDDGEKKVETPLLQGQATSAAATSGSPSSATPVASSTATGPNSCKVCDVKCFSRETFMKHCATDEHQKRTSIHNFVSSEQKYIIGNEPATAQTHFDSMKETVIGLNDVYEMYHVSTRLRFWVCGVCFCGVSCVSNMHSHINSVKHKRRYIECRYPDKKARVTNKNEVAAWLNRAVNDVAAIEGPGILKHALVLEDIPDVLKTVGFMIAAKTGAEPTAKPGSKSTNVGESNEKQAAVDDKKIVKNTSAATAVGGVQAKSTALSSNSGKQEPGGNADVESTGANSTTRTTPKAAGKIGITFQEKPFRQLILADSKVGLQCEMCWDVVIVKDTEVTEHWQKHVASTGHKKNREFRKQWKFSPEHFVSTGPSWHVLSAIQKARQISDVIVGLSDIVESKVIRLGTQIDVTCLLCSTKCVNENYLEAHLASKAHSMKFLNKYYPEEVATVFKGFDKTLFSEMIQFFKNHNVPPGTVRVFDPRASKSATPDVIILSPDQTVTPSAKPKTEHSSQKTIKTGEQKKNENGQKVASGKSGSGEKTGEQKKSIREHGDGKKPNVKESSSVTKGKETKADASKSPPKKCAPSVKDTKIPEKKADSSKANTTGKSTSNDGGGGKTLMDAVVTKITEKPVQPSTPSDRPTEKNSVSHDDEFFIKLLMGSPSEPIPVRYHAFAQPILDQCKDPLVGVEEIHEFCSRDPTHYEPGYICKMCRCRCNCNDLIAHLTSIEHRLKYFENKHPSVYYSLTAGASQTQKSILQALAIKQHAQMIEQKEGRQRLSQRLMIQVDPVPYGMRKRMGASSAAASTATGIPAPFNPSVPPPPFLGGLPLSSAARVPVSSTSQQSTARGGDIFPPGVSVGDNTSTTSVLDRVTAPMSAKCPPPPGVSTSNTSSKKDEKAWQARCEQFLAKLSGNGRTSTKDQSKSSNVDSTKTVSKTTDNSKVEKKVETKTENNGETKPEKKLETKTEKKVETKTEDTGKKDATKSGQRTSQQNSERRQRSRSRSRSRRSRSRSRYPRTRTRSRSRSRSRSHSRSRSRSHRRTKEDERASAAKSKKTTSTPTSKMDSKQKTKSPQTKPQPTKNKNQNESPEKKRVSSDDKGNEKKKARTEDASSSKVEGLPELLIKLTEQLVKGSTPATVTKPTPPKDTKPKLEDMKSQLESLLLNRLMAEKTKSTTTTSTATTSRGESGLSSVLAMLVGGRKEESAKVSKSSKPSTSSSSGTPGEMGLLMKLLADEEERQRKQEDQKKSIIALLQARLGSIPTATSTTVAPAPPAAMVIDYGHGAPASTTRVSKQPQSEQQRPSTSTSKIDAADDLIKEAMWNVRKAQGVSTSTGSAGPRAMPPRPMFPPVDLTRPPPPMPPMMPNMPPMMAQANPQAAAIVNAAAAMLLNSIFNQPRPPTRN